MASRRTRSADAKTAEDLESFVNQVAIEFQDPANPVSFMSPYQLKREMDAMSGTPYRVIVERLLSWSTRVHQAEPDTDWSPLSGPGSQAFPRTPAEVPETVVDAAPPITRSVVTRGGMGSRPPSRSIRAGFRVSTPPITDRRAATPPAKLFSWAEQQRMRAAARSKASPVIPEDCAFQVNHFNPDGLNVAVTMDGNVVMHSSNLKSSHNPAMQAQQLHGQPQRSEEQIAKEAEQIREYIDVMPPVKAADVQAVDDAIQSVLYDALGPQAPGFQIPVKAPVQLHAPVPLVPLARAPKGYQG
mmetsp:Transcript_35523/g.63495  ORF Transcript_35523/g.63495 Transcript_35523/m.63495 type:complete len:300 (-) Transcript_35523:474-1373(-)